MYELQAFRRAVNTQSLRYHQQWRMICFDQTAHPLILSIDYAPKLIRIINGCDSKPLSSVALYPKGFGVKSDGAHYKRLF